MDLQFKRGTVSCLDPVIREVRSAEQTQEIRLPDTYPDAGRVLAAWGQPILRSKEWGADVVRFSGGMMVWILYAPEDGGAERCIDTWIPFQLKWELPDGTAEGRLRMTALTRALDARTVSPRKLMVRAGISVLGEAWAPMEAETFSPETEDPVVQLLENTYPLRLYSEAGERLFVLAEDLTLPPSAPEAEKLLYYRLSPRVTETRVLGDKIVFRGNANLHILYRSKEGQLHSWDFPLGFSQYAELDREHGSDSLGDVQVSLTGMELELDGEGKLHMRAGMTGQYILTDIRQIQVVEDAYSPGREVQPQRAELTLPVILDARRENLYGEQHIATDANIAADVSFLPEFPRQRRTDSAAQLEIPGVFQVLYYGEDGVLRSGTARWEGTRELNADGDSRIHAFPVPMEPQASAENGKIQLQAEVPVDITATARQAIPMVTGLQLGQPLPADPNRPALILRRSGGESLWDIAKSSGSTPEAIRRANALQNQPAPDQMLLIPVV